MFILGMFACEDLVVGVEQLFRERSAFALSYGIAVDIDDLSDFHGRTAEECFVADI